MMCPTLEDRQTASIPPRLCFPRNNLGEKTLEEPSRPIFQWKWWGGEGAPLTLRLSPPGLTRPSQRVGCPLRNEREAVVPPSDARGQHHLPAQRRRSARLSWRQQTEASPRRPRSLAAVRALPCWRKRCVLCRGNWPWLRPQRQGEHPPTFPPRSSRGAERRRPAGWRKVG